MITTQGGIHIKRYLAEMVPHIGQSIALGIGSTAESAGDTRLKFEVVRSSINIVSYDFVTNKLIFKATMPSGFLGKVWEIGLYSQPADQIAAAFGSNLITDFEVSTVGGWIGGTFVPILDAAADPTHVAPVRFGAHGLQLAPAASTTSTSVLSGLSRDFSGYSANDLFSFAFHVGNAFTSQVRFRFMTDASNYYTITLGAQSAGYQITSVAKSAATVTGAPDWSLITQIEVDTTATSGGAGQVTFDGIRIEDVDTINPEYLLVAREVLTSPIVKTVAMPQDAEFALTVTA